MIVCSLRLRVSAVISDWNGRDVVSKDQLGDVVQLGRTPGLHPGNEGSNPSFSTEALAGANALVAQFGRGARPRISLMQVRILLRAWK